MKKKSSLMWIIILLASIIMSVSLLIGIIDKKGNESPDNSTNIESDSRNQFDNDASDIF
jgi:hypothetical protein